MSRIIFRPNQAIDYGTVNTTGQGNVLGDNNANTYKDFYDDSGSILLYPNFDPSVIPDGRQIIAVRAGHTQKNGGLIFLANGWVMGYLRIDGGRVLKSKAYKQDNYDILTARPVEGPAIYKGVPTPWDAADINRMTTDVGAATGAIAPNKNNYWCICPEGYIIIVLDDPVPVPVIFYPAPGETIFTSSVDFKATCVPTQSEQPVATVFQVSRSQFFDDDTVQTFIGGLNQDTTPGTKSLYDSIIGKDSYTNLGPGKWWIRCKGRDYREVDSAWGESTWFRITHQALPVPVLTNPGSGTTKATPYGLRQASLPTTPVGERYVGAQWQFCQNADFTTGLVVSWTNNNEGRFDAGVVEYTADPDPTVAPAMDGKKVSTDDPDQYLKQGTWFGRVRAVDIWDQVGAWSGSHSFTVSHPPAALDVWPQGGKAFDDDAFPVRWRFGDPWTGDTQSAFRVIVKDPGTNTIHDTGKVTSPFNNVQVSIPDSWKEQTLGLSVQLWDKDDVPSPVWNGSFKHSTAPYITVNYPAPDEVVITGQPNISWTVTYAPGASQKSYQLAFINRTTKVIEYKTIIIPTTATTWLAPTVIIKNLRLYQLALTIMDTNDLYTTLLRNFSTDYVHPPSLQCDAFANAYDEDGFVTILWPDAVVDPLFVEYRLYRKSLEEPEEGWVQIATITNPNQFEYHDWSTAGNGSYIFSITQVVMLYGALVESLQDETGDPVEVVGSHYWFIVPDNEALNTKVRGVSDEKFDQRIEQAQHNIMEGGGTRVNYGRPIGREGSMTVRVRGSSTLTAKQMAKRIEQLQFEMHWCFLRDPFGNYIRIAIGQVSTSRMAGVGMNPYVDLEIPYVQVADPPVNEGYAG